ncbi:MAG: 1-acyl-sn-glycerol-3-phosphate acyltransferase [Pseudonocardiales bacterium]|jgi:1-acyl-sn-glycerol-3-phosphate acyltransferase|nr:1-acyl-sn-glycerol-3-phosphate acyltransferase [Pseudonocardiales bacterium]
MYAPSVTDRIHGSAALRRRQATARALARALGRVEMRGLENVPASGPVILAVNHRDFLDGPLLFGFVRRPVSFLVKTEAFTRLWTPMLEGTGQIPVVRHRPDFGAVRLSLRLLQGGGVIGIFPEGSRGDGLVKIARPGVGYLALRTGAQVVPVACHGTDSLMHRRSVRRPVVLVCFGEPLDLGRVPDGQRVNRRAVLGATERVRAVLADLVAHTMLPAELGLAA